MGKRTFLRRNWKLVVNLATLGMMVLLVALIRSQIASTWENLGKVAWPALLLIIPLILVGYHAQTRMYQRLFRILGHSVGYAFMLRASLELNFVNQVFPSGGVSGFSYFGVRMRATGATSMQATLVQLFKLLLVFVSFEPLLLAGEVLLVRSDKASDITLVVAGSITALLFVGTAVFVAVAGSPRRLRALLGVGAKLVNMGARLFRPHHGDVLDGARLDGAVRDVSHNYTILRTHVRKLIVPFMWALVLNLTAIASIYVVYLAFGSWVNVGAIILAYSVANFAGLISVLPGGTIIYEALMTASLVAGGIPVALGLPVTVMYRVLSTLVQLPPGYALYRQALGHTGKTPLDQPHAT